MNKSDKNLPLEAMLKDYCRVNPPYKFTVDLEDNTMKSSNRKIFTAVACAALVLVCVAVFAVGAGNNFFGGDAEDYGFIITAYAEGQGAEEAQIISSTEVDINKDYPLIEKNYDRNGEFESFVIHDLCFGVEGEDIAFFDAKSDKGYLSFEDVDKCRLSAENATENGKVYDYYVYDTQLFNLPVDTEGGFIKWYPGCVSEDISDESVQNRDELIVTAEDYTEYFGDTVTITVKYKDGSEKTAVINLTFDENGYVKAAVSENSDAVDVY